MECVAILGANSLLGQHLVDEFSVNAGMYFINCWDQNDKFVNTFEGLFIK